MPARSASGAFAITARDSRRPNDGQIILSFAGSPVRLYEWTIIDAQGGRTTTEIEGNALNISGPIRWSVDAEYERSSPLYDSERDIRREEDEIAKRLARSAELISKIRESENEFFPLPHVAMNWALSDSDFVAAAFYARGGMNTKWVGGTATYGGASGVQRVQFITTDARRQV
mgnify:CR=1 FL=1